MTLPSPPAVCAQYAGPLQVWTDVGSSNALQFVGWTVNGAEIEEIAYMAPIHSDENGGEAGPPIDYQYFGAQHRITLEFQKYQPAVLASWEARYNPNASSANVGVGMLLACSNAMFRCLLFAAVGGVANYIRNYIGCVIPEPIGFSPVGTQASRARVTLLANPINGVIYNSTYT